MSGRRQRAAMALVKSVSAAPQLARGDRCDTSGAITRINMLVNEASDEGNLLSGTLPTQLCEFEALEELELSFNNITGTMPTQLAVLKNLEQLRLKTTPFLSGTIPTQLLDSRRPPTTNSKKQEHLITPQHKAEPTQCSRWPQEITNAM